MALDFTTVSWISVAAELADMPPASAWRCRPHRPRDTVPRLRQGAALLPRSTCGAPGPGARRRGCPWRGSARGPAGEPGAGAAVPGHRAGRSSTGSARRRRERDIISAGSEGTRCGSPAAPAGPRARCPRC
ncbi:hypothetical protein QJS66_18065 [Kocuria rhizophila]|nr:hypothetical protein QJS66_18065 [Kocuria rhizophila]